MPRGTTTIDIYSIAGLGKGLEKKAAVVTEIKQGANINKGLLVDLARLISITMLDNRL